MYELSAITILYVEDEPELREHVAYALRLYCDQVTTATNGEEALALVRQRQPDLVISDIRMPLMDGLGLASALKEEFPGLPVILCTAFADTEYLLRAIELGVAAYATKPIDTGTLMERIQQVALPLLQRREMERLRREALQARSLLFGTSPAMTELGSRLVEVAGSDYAVVIGGEAGSGKSVVAELLHGMSKRRDKPVLTVDCRGRASDQVEAELFGLQPGRGRPAEQRANGLLHAFNGGTLVLDAPECLPTALQARILRVLEERSYQPTGTAVPLPCDLRAIVVSEADLELELREGRLLSGLWLRLSELVLTVPPLRERREEIPRLCRSFLAQAAGDLGRHCPELAPDAAELLVGEPWPGNLRQLKQVMRRALFLAGNPICATGIRPLLASNETARQAPGEAPPSLKLAELDQWAVRQALSATNGKKMQAAELLGISYNSFKERLRRYDIH